MLNKILCIVNLPLFVESLIGQHFFNATLLYALSFALNFDWIAHLVTKKKTSNSTGIMLRKIYSRILLISLILVAGVVACLRFDSDVMLKNGSIWVVFLVVSQLLVWLKNRRTVAL